VSGVLIDTSVWRRFFRGAPAAWPLAELISEGEALTHPFVLGELILGGLAAREERLFGDAVHAEVVPHDEVLALVRHRRLSRRGLGFIDAHLLASALVSSAALWSFDAALAAAAAELDVAIR
jgi:predicted nucleic acid-binding protein